MRRLLAACAAFALAGCATQHVAITVTPAAPAVTDAQRAAGIIAYRVTTLRVRQEAALARMRGAPVPLPTGACAARFSIDRAGMVAGEPVVECAPDALAPVMRQAIFAAAPFNAFEGQTRFSVRINMPNAEPGIQGG